MARNVRRREHLINAVVEVSSIAQDPGTAVREFLGGGVGGVLSSERPVV